MEAERGRRALYGEDPSTIQIEVVSYRVLQSIKAQ